MLEIRDLSCGYGRRTVLSGISFSLAAGELLCLLGPNGVGKTTLFKTLLGLLPAHGGEVRLDGQPIGRWSRRRFARRVGYVPQAHTPPFPFKVRQVVAMGRTAHLAAFAAPGRADLDIAEAALETLGIAALAEATYTEISGGERQLVLIARALAQQPRLLVMDEPTANLDYGNQLRVMAHVRRIVGTQGLGVILTTHDPNQALLHATRALVLERDRRYGLGTPAEVVDDGYLRRTYGVETEIIDLARPCGTPRRICVPAEIGVRP
ncbi:ABC transporter ATP-binding protein [Imhoffiella purpurea]|uniref:ABC transporter n=1 Tax=Imhoffiella purpurea TaxID=1249627 RepID=W9VFL0_9GAMM|nr:ABC transporter ATP-binding protein [Imhoffiella purpurea]EXJ15801.1 ABC transporter [Imhoffiella purpurea]